MLLTVEDLTKIYIKKKILNNVSFSVKKGEIFGEIFLGDFARFQVYPSLGII